MGSFARGMVSKVLQSGRQPLLCKDISGLTSASLRLNHLSTHHSLDVKAVGDILGAGSDSVSRTPRLTKESARRLAKNFTAEDRQLLLKEIQEIKGDEAIMQYSGSLASLRWRSRVGRPASFGESDPSGRFCVIPTNWLKQRLAQSIPKPTASQLIHMALFNSIPFLGFGFLDNVIMITAGDYIEASMGVALGISTMAAAALGNAVSDVAGIGSAFYVELIAMRIGVPAPTMTAEQQDLKISHWFSNLGRAFGVALGCLIGMFPLMFLPGHNKEKEAASDADLATASVVPVVEAQSTPAAAAAAVEPTASTTQPPLRRLAVTSSPAPSHPASAAAERTVSHAETSSLGTSNPQPAEGLPGK